MRRRGFSPVVLLPAPPARPEPDYPEYAGLRALAEESVRRDGDFVDPVKLRMRESSRRDRDWAISVVGDGRRGLVELHMLLLAEGQDINPPLPGWLAEARAAAAEKNRAEEQAWQDRLRALEDAWRAIYEKLGFAVGVAYNYSGPHHYETYTSGAVHILTWVDLNRGRLVRPVGAPLCWTPSRAGHLEFADRGDPADRRVPTCKACIRSAAKLAGDADGHADVLLSQGRRRAG